MKDNVTRTFTTLAIVILILFAGTIAAGLILFAQDGAEAKQEYLVHFYLGLTTSMVVLLVHCLIFTYLLGTGRWVKEVGLAYQLPDQPYPKWTRELKRQTFPPALFAMLSVIAAAAAGAGAEVKIWPWYLHAMLAAFTVVVNLWAFRIEYRNLQTNAGIIVAVLEEVDRIRIQQGLSSNAEALLQEQQRLIASLLTASKSLACASGSRFRSMRARRRASPPALAGGVYRQAKVAHDPRNLYRTDSPGPPAGP